MDAETTTRALMELMEANVSPLADTEAWETEVQFLQQDEPPTPALLRDTPDADLDVATESA